MDRRFVKAMYKQREIVNAVVNGISDKEIALNVIVYLLEYN